MANGVEVVVVANALDYWLKATLQLLPVVCPADDHLY